MPITEDMTSEQVTIYLFAERHLNDKLYDKLDEYGVTVSGTVSGTIDKHAGGYFDWLGDYMNELDPPVEYDTGIVTEFVNDIIMDNYISTIILYELTTVS